MRDFQHVRVWRASHRMTLAVYRASAGFPLEERYGLTSQLWRSAASIGANIAEGIGRGSDADTRRFLYQALSSCFELLNHLLLARDLGYLRAESFARFERATVSIRRMLLRFHREPWRRGLTTPSDGPRPTAHGRLLKASPTLA